MNWVDEFKVALATGNEKKLTSLCREVPAFNKLEDLKVAANLLEGAREFFEQKKQECKNEMDMLKKTQNFVNNDIERVYNKIDITS